VVPKKSKVWLHTFAQLINKSCPTGAKMLPNDKIFRPKVAISVNHLKSLGSN